MLIHAQLYALKDKGEIRLSAYNSTLWYRRTEVNLRIAVFFSAATVAGEHSDLHRIRFC